MRQAAALIGHFRFEGARIIVSNDLCYGLWILTVLQIF